MSCIIFNHDLRKENAIRELEGVYQRRVLGKTDRLLKCCSLTIFEPHCILLKNPIASEN